MNAPERLLGASFDEAYFEALATTVDRLVAPHEAYLLSAAAETSEFVRFNHGKVRQPGWVTQCYVDLELVDGLRHAAERLSLSGVPAVDRDLLAAAVRALRDVLPDLAEDPHLLFATDVVSTRHAAPRALPSGEEVVEHVLRAAEGEDLVGIFAGGRIARAFANSLGQRNWHETGSIDLQWSLYHRADKAVKGGWAGLAWDPQEVAARVEENRGQLAWMARPSRSLDPGAYRAYLAPAALEEVLSLLQWGGFSGRAIATKQSSLQRLADGATELAPAVTLTEATAAGLAPRFQAQGFVRPDEVPLVRSGRWVGALVAPRTAREFGLAANAANNGEVPESLAMAGGELAHDDVLAALDTGLYVSNLWYLNYSDRPACRMTGMTRFATVWVENGRIAGPVDVLRFDDTLQRMLGTELEALTRGTELRLDANTYGQRSLASVRLPGALLASLAFTL